MSWQDNCHCGSPLNGSDHCPFCGCEQFESTCDANWKSHRMDELLDELLELLNPMGTL